MRKTLLAFCLLIVLPLAHATTFDAVGSFSTTSNPTGVWAYGYGSFSNFILYNTHTTSGGTTAWTSSSIGNLPAIIYNPSGYTGTTLGVPSTELGLHPGSSSTGQDSILRFTVPTSGIYNLSSSFTRRDNTASGNGVNVSIYLDGLLLTGSSKYLSNTSGHTSFTYNNAALSLVAGDVLLFDVNNNGDYNYDTTGVTATLTNASVATTPEPSSLVLLGSGMLSLIAAGRRRLSRS